MQFWDFWPAYGSWVLAILGAVVTLVPDMTTGRRRWAWLAAFVVAGFLTARGVDISQKKMEATINGGDCFAHFEAGQAIVLSNGETVYPLNLFGGCAPIFDMNYTISEIIMNGSKLVKSVTLRSATMATVLPGAYDTGVKVRPGSYGMSMFGRNGYTFEKLILPETGPVAQQFYVKRPTLSGQAETFLCVPAAFCADGSVEETPEFLTLTLRQK